MGLPANIPNPGVNADTCKAGFAPLARAGYAER